MSKILLNPRPIAWARMYGSPKVRVGPKSAERTSRGPEMPGFVTGEVGTTARTEKPPIIRLFRPDEEAATRAHDDVTEKAWLYPSFPNGVST